MTEDKLGDSYDIVKQSPLRWLGGKWSVHPMLTAPPSAAFESAYSNLVGATVLSVLRADRGKRKIWLARADSCPSHLFLDPDKGLILNTHPSHQQVSVDELAEITKMRSRALTVIFDMSFDRRVEREQKLKEKLDHLLDRGVCAFAYFSPHVCFIIAGEQSLVSQARSRVIAKSGLPEHRFTSTTTLRSNRT